MPTTEIQEVEETVLMDVPTTGEWSFCLPVNVVALVRRGLLCGNNIFPPSSPCRFPDAEIVEVDAFRIDRVQDSRVVEVDEYHEYVVKPTDEVRTRQ